MTANTMFGIFAFGLDSLGGSIDLLGVGCYRLSLSA
jgi:hypothetical protein